jgi:serine protease
MAIVVARSSSRASESGAKSALALARSSLGCVVLAFVVAACGGGGGGGEPAPAANTPPVANAGAARSVEAGSVVNLDGRASTDANGDAITYSWTITTRPAGSSAALSGATTATPSLRPDVAGSYVVQLTVSDGRASSAPATVTITATPPNAAPVANAGPDQTGVTGTLVRLDGRQSSDPNNDSLSYIWALVSPAGSTATLQGANTATPTFTPDIVGIYAAGLVVNDGRVNSAADAVVIRVTSPTVGPFSVSGTVTAVNVSTVDSDTNDPLQQGRAANNTLATAQPSGNPGLVAGYVNQPGSGPQGPNFAGGDLSDIFAADLVAGQVVELSFGDANAADLDLFVYDALGNLAGQSIGVSRSECVLVRRSGRFRIQVTAFSGASNYELSWGSPRPNSTCPNVTPASADVSAFVPGELIGKAVTSAAPAAPTGTAGLLARLKGAGVQPATQSAHDAPFLLRLPTGGAQRAESLRALKTASRQPTLGTIAAPQPVHRAPSDASESARLAYDTTVALKTLRLSGEVAYAELNLVLEASQVGYGNWPPNDTDLSRQPHLELIGLPQAFATLNALAPRPTHVPIVAVVDNGIVADHPELRNMLVAGYDFVSNAENAADGQKANAASSQTDIDADPNDTSQPGQNTSFHGTHVAGTVAAQTFNGAGVVGVAPMARIMPVRVLGVSGSGSLYDILQGVRFAAGLANDSGTTPARRADVINLSLGGAGSCTAAMADTIASARAQGAIIVAAAGNDSGAPVGAPANCAGAIAVSSIAYDGNLASYSNVGPEVKVTAPGGDSARLTPAGRDTIWSLGASFVTDTAGRSVRVPSFRGLQGTSMSAPHVAGVLALMRAVNPNLTPAAVDGLFASGALTDDVGAPGKDNQFGYGRMNAAKAVLATGTAAPALPTLQLSPTILDFGSTLTELTITATRVNGSTDTPTQYRRNALDPRAVQLFTPAGGNPPNGPFAFIVRIDRALLAPSESVIRVELLTAQLTAFPFDVVIAPRPVFAATQRGVGPLYSVALNADDPSRATIAGSVSQSTTPTYTYTIGNVTVPRVVIAAGIDLDNDGFICGPSEPCGWYPTLGSPETLTLTNNRAGVNFSLIPGSTIGAQAVSEARAQRGFARP